MFFKVTTLCSSHDILVDLVTCFTLVKKIFVCKVLELQPEFPLSLPVAYSSEKAEIQASFMRKLLILWLLHLFANYKISHHLCL